MLIQEGAMEIAVLLKQGLGVREVVRRCGVSRNTVRRNAIRQHTLAGCLLCFSGVRLLGHHMLLVDGAASRSSALQE